MNKESICLSSLLLLSVVLSSCDNPMARQGDPPPPMPVKVANPITRTVQLTDTYVGRFQATESVELRARVSGYLESIHFKEGQKVKKGDLMFQIDPRPFDAQVAAAEARTKQAEARVQLAENNQRRAEKLLKDNAISGEEADIRRSETAQAKADLLAAQAAERSARLDREFAEIRAPISGITSDFKVTPGNYISGGIPNATLLTTIVPHRPIHAVFDVDERQVLRFVRMYFEGKSDGRGGEQPEVEIGVSDRDEFEFKGRIDFSDNELDESTATTRLRALVPNENEFLTPGLFAKIRLGFGDPFEAMLVRDSALGFDQNKRFAWVVDENNTVSRRYVEVGDLQGEMRIIESGLELTDRIVVTGIQLLRRGLVVNPDPVPMDSGENAPPAEGDNDQASATDGRRYTVPNTVPYSVPFTTVHCTFAGRTVLNPVFG